MNSCPHCGMATHTADDCPRLIMIEGQRRLERRRTARTAPDRAAIDAAFKALRDELRRGDLEQRALIERQRLELERLKDSLGRARAVLRFYRELVDDVVETVSEPARKHPARVH